MYKLLVIMSQRNFSCLRRRRIKQPGDQGNQSIDHIDVPAARPYYRLGFTSERTTLCKLISIVS